MRFSIAVNMSRLDPATDMREVVAQALELVQIADAGGFEIAWAAEHHTIETTISPNPFTLLTYWGQHTKRIRLGTGIVSAPYWHPIRLAGEAALADILLDGRLEVGLGRGAYQYEFDRMANGMEQREGGRYLREIIPAIKKLWAGDYAHDGELWRFPTATAVPKPLQKPHPRLWVAARDINTFRFAAQNDCHIMSNPLSLPYEEVVTLCERYEQVADECHSRPEHIMLRPACVYPCEKDWEIPVNAAIKFGRHFENLFNNLGGVKNGFTEAVDFDGVKHKQGYTPEDMHDNMIFGTPDAVIAKLEKYRAAGVDHFLYGATFGLPHEAAVKSLNLFCEKVIPHFAKNTHE